jgi:SsrA-binding protein
MATAVDPARHRTAAQNRKARHDFFIQDTLEAGIMLQGSEVKSLRQGHASIGEAFAVEKDGALVLVNAHIPEYSGANRFNHEPNRPRKLLLHKRELNRLIGQVQRAGVTIVPLSIYFNDRGIAKVSLGIAKGKRKTDKRQDEKKRDWQRDKARLMRDKS